MAIILPLQTHLSSSSELVFQEQLVLMDSSFMLTLWLKEILEMNINRQHQDVLFLCFPISK